MKVTRTDFLSFLLMFLFFLAFFFTFLTWKNQMADIDRANFYVRYALWKRNFGEEDKAIEYLKKTTELKYSVPEAHTLLASFYLKKGFVKEALRHLKISAEKFPHYQTYFLIGYIEFSLGRYEEAKRFLEKCLKLKADFQEAFELLNQLKSSLK